MRHFFRHFLFIPVLIILAPIGSRAHGASPQQVNDAIERGKAWLYAQARDGTWESGEPPKGLRQRTHWGGHTAIAIYALLAAGEKPNNPALRRAIEFLEKANDVDGTYAVGLRAQVWWFLGASKETAEPIRRDTSLLLAGSYESGPLAGMYTYSLLRPGGTGSTARIELRPAGPRPESPPGPNSRPPLVLNGRGPMSPKYDHSNSQYGVLGVWALAEVGGEVPLSYWRTVDAAWKKAQNADGGWDYIDGRQSKASMTAAGIATLYITQDFLMANSSWSTCTPRPPDPHIAKGLAWMDSHIRHVLDGKDTYLMYGIERIGLASGRKYFGNVAWFETGADQLVSGQNPDGSWDSHFAGRDDLASTAYAILFLSRGRAPVMMNKLEYGISVDSTKPTPAVSSGQDGEAWNERPRDLANLTKWVGRATEGFYNWQMVSLDASPDDLHDAPILYVTGRDAVHFTDAEQLKLRRFVEQGGLILANADCGRDAFAASIRQLGAVLFPKYEFRELPKDHLIYTGQQYSAAKWKTHPHLLGLSNGVRELMILVPDFDPSRLWQSGGAKGHEEPFQLGADLFIYMTGGKDPRVRPRTWIVHSRPTTQPARTLSLARLEIGDNSDPEPGGWRRMSALLHNDQHIDLDVKTVKPEGTNLSNFRIAHWTGTTTVKLNDEQRAALREFVTSGGTLIVDAAGGSTFFAESAEAELRKIFGSAAEALQHPLAAEHPAFNGPDSKIDSVQFRTFTRKASVGTNKIARVRGITIDDRIGVFYSPEDLSAGLVGEQVDGVSGYDPISATRIMTHLILYACVKPEPVTQPVVRELSRNP